MILIPDRLAELLRRDRTLDADVKKSLDELEPWLEAGGKRPTFFPDYTDHSVQHIQEVLETAVSLIRDEAWPALTPGDAAVLVLSTLLHDSAMHLTREGFEALVRPGTRWTPIDGFGDKPWPQLWADFCLEARRFDQRRLTDLFGDAEPVQIPELDHLKLDDGARRLIGEFVRRHHPRLAHETARHGAPGHADEPLRIHGNGEIVDLAGLVARSHGLSARACLPYLKQHFGSRTDPLGVHAVFLIALLRVADYLQIQAGRAPERTLKVHKIRSPYSAVEWKLHASVRDIRRHEEDTEAVYVRAKPEDVETYLRLKGWLSGLQGEIDASWAVLGEVYSRQGEGMDRLGMKVRRVFSNLDDEREFTRSAAFLPRHVRFTTSGADLLKLLIFPLYGNRPEIGVRELIQNAVDAVREFDNLRERGVLAHVSSPAVQGTGVVVKLLKDEGGDWWLTITDRGIGMTPEVVSDFFLKAGASFRNSSDWQSLFWSGPHKSHILRIGRFGIGTLAAFLLGESLEVVTRHAGADEKEGLSFTASLDTDPIQIHRCTAPAGTTIRIKLFPAAAEKLLKRTENWDWYCLEHPAVTRMVEDTTLRQAYRVPTPDSTLPDSWHHVTVPGYEAILWTYGGAPTLCHNGIHVSFSHETGVSASQILETNNLGISFRAPKIAIFDSGAKFLENLQRTALPSQLLPFREELLDSIFKDYMAFGVSSAPTWPLGSAADPSWYLGNYPGTTFVEGRTDMGLWCSGPDGIFPCESGVLWSCNLDRVMITPVIHGYTRSIQSHHAITQSFTLPVAQDVANPSPSAVHRHVTSTWKPNGFERVHAVAAISDLEPMLRFWMHIASEPEAFRRKRVINELLKAYHVVGITVLGHRQVRSSLDKAIIRRTPMLEPVWVEQIGDAEIQTYRGLKTDDSPLKQTEEALEYPIFPLVEWRLERKPDRPEETMLYRYWSALLGGGPIPFAQQDRMQTLSLLESAAKGFGAA